MIDTAAAASGAGSAPLAVTAKTAVLNAARPQRAPSGAEGGASGWVRRNAGWMGLFTVLLLCLLAGLLVGHWASQGGSKAPATQTVKIEGLAGLHPAQRFSCGRGGERLVAERLKLHDHEVAHQPVVLHHQNGLAATRQ